MMLPIEIDRISDHHFINSWLKAANTYGRLLVVDLGMNAGDFSREIIRRYPNARVVAVEANPDLALAGRHSANLRCYNCAIAPENGPVTFGVDRINSTASSLDLSGDHSETVTVEGVQFSELLQRAEIDGEVIDILKIDIEGSELELFERTADRVLLNMRQISIEFHAFLNPDHKPRIAKILQRMTSLNFHCIDFTTNFQDVLMINKSLGLSRVDQFNRTKLVLLKYTRGLKRILSRALTSR
jgi:FkbM family methyltransferase